MRLFITGASGFVGGTILKDLVRDFEVMALSDSSETDNALAALGVNPIRGDVDIITSQLLDGIDAVINCAPRADDWNSNHGRYKEQVTSTQHLLDMAAEAGVKRFIHIGTDCAIYQNRDFVDADESAPLAVNSPFSFVWTNAKTEEAVLNAHRPDGMTTIVLRAHVIWGPGDSDILDALREMVRTNSFVWINQGKAKINTTHIRNLIHAVRLALKKGTGAYFIADGDGHTTHREFLSQITKSADIELTDRSIPAFFSHVAVYAVAMVWRLLGRNDAPFFDLFMVSYVARDHTSTGKKAAAELGYVPVISREQGLAELRATR